MAEKVTWMVLKVNLNCPSCYKEVKKILCKFPEIRDQVYDEQKNLVKITVVCCSPGKIRDKLCSKGGKVIKSIEILEPQKPPKQDKQPAPTPTQKPIETTKALGVPVPYYPFPFGFGCPKCCGGCGGGPCYYGYVKLIPPPPYCDISYDYGYSSSCMVM